MSTPLLSRVMGLMLLFCLISGILTNRTTLYAQVTQEDIRLEIEMLPRLKQAQSFSLSTLGIDLQGSGARLMNIVLENRSDRELDNLYFSVKVLVSGIGVITELDQKQDRPFSMRPGQVVIANNNDLYDGIPGISEHIQLRGEELTAAGEEFVNSLIGSTTLPDRIYSVLLQIYYGNNRLYGGMLVAEAGATLPTEELFTDLDFDLISPGAELGAVSDQISSRRPVFRWEGSAAQTYRIVIVEDMPDQTAQGLIQAALDSDPVIGTHQPGELLEFEMADAVVRSNSFVYPVSDVQMLESGKKYYWQVFVQLNTPSGVDWYPSPIWEFRIQSPGQPSSDLEEQVLAILTQILPERYQSMLLEGYAVHSAEMDGRTVSGLALLLQLEEFLNDLESGRIRIVE